VLSVVSSSERFEDASVGSYQASKKRRVEDQLPPLILRFTSKPGRKEENSLRCIALSILVMNR
jgi:hypothetical protein